MKIFVTNTGQVVNLSDANLVADSGRRRKYDSEGYFGDVRTRLYTVDGRWYEVIDDLVPLGWWDRWDAVTKKDEQSCYEREPRSVGHILRSLKIPLEDIERIMTHV